MATRESALDATLELQQDFLAAFNHVNGIIAPACEFVGITRQTYYNWLKKYPDFKIAVEEIAERQIDFVELKLQEGIRAGTPGLITFYLSTKGKKRGYGVKPEAGKDDDDFTPVDQAILDNYVKERIKKLEIEGETEAQKIARLKAEALATSDMDDDDF